MIHGASQSSEEWKFMSYFERKWSSVCPLKDCKCVNSSIEEANSIVSEAVEDIINEKKKANEQKVDFLWKHLVTLELWVWKVKLK